MNHMKIGMFYVRVCACGAVLQSIQVTPWNAREVAKFKESAARCGYDTEHDLPGWTVVPWKARGGYGSQGVGAGRANAAREVVWFSPHCLPPASPTLFGDGLEEASA